MNEAQTFHCPSCSAPLDAPVDAESVRCPYCGSTVFAPQSPSGTQPFQIPNAYAQPVTVFTTSAALDLNELKDLLRQGQKIEAIKRLRLATGLGLKESNDVVDALERDEDMAAVSALLGGMLSPRQPAGEMLEVISLAQSGNKMEAVKRYHQITGAGLRASQEAVEALLAGQPMITIQTASADQGSQPLVLVNGDSVPVVNARQAAKAIGVAGASISCGVIALVVIILLATIIPVFFALSQEGAPLAPFWNQVNPLSIANIELRFGEEGIGAGQFSDPRTIAADAGGNIYAADYSTGRLQSFDSNGGFRWLANLGEDNYVQALDVDRNGALLVVARGQLRRFDPASGAELAALPNLSDYYVDDVAVGVDGRIAAIVDSEDILVLDPDYQPILFVQEAVSSVSGDSELDSDIDIDGLGNLYVLGHFNNSVFMYSPDGRFTNRFASEGDEKGQLSAPGDLAIDGQGRVFISDFNGVQIFSSDGRYLDQFDLGGYVFGLNFDLQERLYTVSNEPQVMRLRLEK